MSKGPPPPPFDHADFGNNRPADPATLTPWLAKMQGNILKGHGRDHTVHLFFRWDAAATPQIRRFIVGLLPSAAPQQAAAATGPFAPPPPQPPVPFVPPASAQVADVLITSAARQAEESEIYNRFHIPGATFANFFLTAAGYRQLGFGPEHLDAFFPESSPDGNTRYFKEGMKAHRDDLADPPPGDPSDETATGWDLGYRGEIHAMLLIADDDRAKLLREARTMITKLERIAGVEVVQVEIGDALRNEDDQTIEHFGYVDGRSQPLFLTSDFKLDDQGRVVERNSKRGGLIDKWNPVEQPGLVLVDDLAAAETDCKGSYFVFRKLEQDVMRFKIREQELADALKLERDDRERAGAMAVGRFEDGTPVTASRTDGFSPAQENNFTYADDQAGLKCPFHAHIRKTNPRGDTTRLLNSTDAIERSHRIVRRGITYGERTKQPRDLPTLSDLPTDGVGLLFMCFQASIAHQFAFMQRSWADSEAFVKPGTGVDPVIANVPAGTTPAQQVWVNEWNDQSQPPKTTPFGFSQFVKLKGGEFFFAPSLPFLHKLTAPPLPAPPPQPPQPGQPGYGG